MHVIDSDGCPLYVEVEGQADAPVLMLSNSLGATLAMWDDQVPAFAKSYRVVRYDRRGHGRSGVPKGPYAMAQLGRDAIAIMNGLNIAKANWCGLSMGGMVGQWVAANAPERIDKLILSNTSSYFAVKDGWNGRIKNVREGGLAAIADTVMKFWFTEGFTEREPAKVARIKQSLLASPVEGYIACCEAVRDMDHRDLLGTIRAPTLVIAGRHDLSTTVQDAEFIRSRIPGAVLTVLEAAHISNVEQPQRYAAEVLGFLAQK